MRGALSPTERAEARRLCDEATAGPWFLFKNDENDPNEPWQIHGDGGSHVLAQLNRPGMDYSPAQAAVDARLLLAARTLLPRLLDALEAARADALEEAARAVEAFARHYPPHIFREPEPGQHGATVDGCSAAAIRAVLPGIAAEVRELAAAARLPEGGDQDAPPAHESGTVAREMAHDHAGLPEGDREGGAA